MGQRKVKKTRTANVTGEGPCGLEEADEAVQQLKEEHESALIFANRKQEGCIPIRVD
jgi:hypothetical protein